MEGQTNTSGPSDIFIIHACDCAEHEGPGGRPLQFGTCHDFTDTKPLLCELLPFIDGFIHHKTSSISG